MMIMLFLSNEVTRHVFILIVKSSLCVWYQSGCMSRATPLHMNLITSTNMHKFSIKTTAKEREQVKVILSCLTPVKKVKLADNKAHSLVI